jgi:hypothetical protein
MTHPVYSFIIHKINSVHNFFQSYIWTDVLTDMNDPHNQFSIFSEANALEVCLEYYRKTAGKVGNYGLRTWAVRNVTVVR